MIVSLPRLLNSETPNTVMIVGLLGNYVQLKLKHLFQEDPVHETNLHEFSFP